LGHSFTICEQRARPGKFVPLATLSSTQLVSACGNCHEAMRERMMAAKLLRTSG
jgi:hypothetical protein